MLFDTHFLPYSPKTQTDRGTTTHHTSTSQTKVSPLVSAKSKPKDDNKEETTKPPMIANTKLDKDTDRQSSCENDSLADSLGSIEQSQESLNAEYTIDQDDTKSKSIISQDLGSTGKSQQSLNDEYSIEQDQTIAKSSIGYNLGNIEQSQESLHAKQCEQVTIQDEIIAKSNNIYDSKEENSIDDKDKSTIEC